MAAEPESAEPPKRPRWLSEAWARDDGLVLNHPVFNDCGREFKRFLLRNIRFDEYEASGKDTWWDFDEEGICRLKTLAPERLPPLLPKTVGQAVDPRDLICRGGDYDTRLVLVLSGSVEKLVGDASGRCLTRRLHRGDVEGLPEFLGVGGSQQRTCALRAGADGAHVRYVKREAVLKLLKQTVPGKEDDDEPVPRWPREAAHFAALALDRIDALHHKASRELLYWRPLAGAEPLDLLQLEGQSMFRMDNALGTSVSGPLPEGIEERYFLDGQTVIREGVPGDCLIMILRGEVEALVPEGCTGQCLPRLHAASSPGASGSWLGDGRCPSPAPTASSSSRSRPTQAPRSVPAHGDHSPSKGREVAMVALVRPADLKRAARKLGAAAEAGKLDLSDQKTTDWRWSWDDPRALTAIRLLREGKLLSPAGEERAEEVHQHQHPPKPPPQPTPQANLGSGATIGHLALLGVPVVLAGPVRAKGPAHIAVLHRHVLLEAIKECPERAFFEPHGLGPEDWVRVLAKPKAHGVGEGGARATHLGPNTGPPKHTGAKEKAEPAAATHSAWSSSSGRFRDMAGADALEHVLLNAIKDYALLWDLVHDAPPRLLEALVRQFEPRWLLPGEVVIVDEEPDADFLFVVVHGHFVVTLEGAEIDHIGQGAIQGAAQLLNLNDWTRTVTVTATNRGEGMLQVFRRSKLLEVLAGHPVPKGRLRDIEDFLRDAKKADWRLLQNIPAFGSAASKPFLARVFKDADIRLWCPGDYLAEAGSPGMSMIVVLAGVLRSEQAQTLFFVELKRGDWCFQNNILGIEPERAHDVVAVTHAMVLILYRQALLDAVVAHPAAREAVLDNETWRTEASVPQLRGLRVFEGVPAPVLSRLEKEAAPLYFKAGSVMLAAGALVDQDMLLFILRGEARVSILGIVLRTLGVGDSLGVLRYLGLDAPSSVEVVATTPCDVLAVRRDTMAHALEDERWEDDLMPFKNGARVLGGGEILDAWGFAIGGGARFSPDCIEKSEVFRVCSEEFVCQMPKLVEELALWPGEKLFSQGETGDFMFFLKSGRVRLEVHGRKDHEVVGGGSTLGDMACLDQVPYYTETAFAETHVWVRVLHKRLLRRVLSSFPEEERRLLGAAGKTGRGVFA